MEDSPPYRLEIRSLSDEDAADGRASRSKDRPWLGIYFECCGTYTRIYRNHDESAYAGCCPHCGGRVRIPIGPGGTRARFFTAS